MSEQQAMTVFESPTFRRFDNPDGTISFFVRVDRSLTPQEALDATGRKNWATGKVADEMPRGEGKLVEVVFFYCDSGIDEIKDDDLEEKYNKRNLVSADPYSVLVVNRDVPAFADKHPNVTHWKNSDGEWCYLSCGVCFDGRGVLVAQRGSLGYGGFDWFAGLRKLDQTA
ncbi:MAG: hypothetical protein PHX25_01025 [Candidatus Pacebacteria bacterium]|nr:hypothetical protein [Candidatus Paceibacterota bacterium]